MLFRCKLVNSYPVFVESPPGGLTAGLKQQANGLCRQSLARFTTEQSPIPHTTKPN